MYIDIGINLTNKQFAGEYDEVIDRAISAGVEQILLTGTSVRSSKEALALAEEYPETLFATAGIHPHDAKTMNTESIKILAALLWFRLRPRFFASSSARKLFSRTIVIS